MTEDLFTVLSKDEKVINAYQKANIQITPYIIGYLLRGFDLNGCCSEQDARTPINALIYGTKLKVIDKKYRGIITDILSGFILKSEENTETIDAIFDMVRDVMVDEIISGSYNTSARSDIKPLCDDILYQIMDARYPGSSVSLIKGLMPCQDGYITQPTDDVPVITRYTVHVPVNILTIRSYPDDKYLFPKVYGEILLPFRYNGCIMRLWFDRHTGLSESSDFGICPQRMDAVFEYAESFRCSRPITTTLTKDNIIHIITCIHDANKEVVKKDYDYSWRSYDDCNKNVSGFEVLEIDFHDTVCSQVKVISFIFSNTNDCIAIVPMSFSDSFIGKLHDMYVSEDEKHPLGKTC